KYPTTGTMRDLGVAAGGAQLWLGERRGVRLGGPATPASARPRPGGHPRYGCPVPVGKGGYGLGCGPSSSSVAVLGPSRQPCPPPSPSLIQQQQERQRA